MTNPSTSAPVRPAADGTRDPISRMAYVPRDARLMALILQSMGIEDVQPPALMMLLEFANRYLHEVLQDALVYADHANSSKGSSGVSSVTVDDIQLAIQSRVNHSFTAPPSKEMLLSLASSLNSVPLPPISDKYGIKLPPAQHCLTSVNFSIVPNPPPEEEEDEEDGEQGADVRQGSQQKEDDVDEEEEEEDYDDLADDSRIKDESMADASVSAQEQSSSLPRGTKRSLDEDEDYD